MTPGNIKAGWKATGLWPWNIAKPLLSPLLLENSNAWAKGQKTTLGIRLKTPVIDWAATNSVVTWQTPKKSTELRAHLNTISSLDNPDDITRRHLFRKITKGWDERDSLLAEAHLRIDALEARVQSLEPKKRKKVKLNPNTKFGDIWAVSRAAEEAQIGIAEEEDSEESDEDDISVSTVETEVVDCIVVGVGEG